MGRPKGGVNQKVAAAMEKKGAAQAVKDTAAAADREKDTQAEWSKGANNRGAARSDAAAARADEQARKKREKAALLAEEEEALGAGGKAKKKPSLSKNKGKKKKSSDFDLLEDALVSGAEKKQKAKKKAELAKAAKLKADAAKRKKERDDMPTDPLMANTEDAIRGTMDGLVGRAANKALDDPNAASGIDSALGIMSIDGGDGAPALSRKAMFKAYEERMMLEMKQDYSGLKLSQIKEKIFLKWKKSPDNPANQAASHR
mmetsp:Transcript_36082/g.70995  ORF Transcript_36082/g.70995 Transcript_36082/m.70995 type:complete len:259 (-) Transcript_36082:8-784(-)